MEISESSGSRKPNNGQISSSSSSCKLSSGIPFASYKLILLSRSVTHIKDHGIIVKLSFVDLPAEDFSHRRTLLEWFFNNINNL